MISPAPSTGRSSLKYRFLSGGAWSFAGYGLSQAIRFGANLVLTRLLVPEMFALMSIATVVMIGLGLVSDVGLRPSIVRSARGREAIFLNTAWTVQIIRGGILWLAGLAVSLALGIAAHMELLPADSVYVDPRLPYVIGAVSFGVLIGGFNSTKLQEAYRRLAIGHVTLIELFSQIAGLCFTFLWLVFDRSITALVAGSLVSAFVKMLLSHLGLAGNSNRWQFERAAFFEIFHFGKWIMVSSVLYFLASSGDRIILGGIIDTTVFGVYVIAFAIVNVVETLLLRTIGQVMFPALSEIVRERPQTLKRAYYRLHVGVAGAAYLSAGALMVSGQPIIDFLYDERYSQAGWMLQILAVGLLTVPIQLATQSLMALGNAKVQSYVLVVRLVSLIVGMKVGFEFFALPGALWGIVCSRFVPLPIALFYCARYAIFDFWREIMVLPAIVIGVGAGELVAFVIRYYFGA